MFGGMNSQELINGVLIPSETSMELVTKAIINSGTVKPTYKGGDITAQHIDQPLKNADIHYMPTKGAVKQGIANMNPNTYYKGKHDLNFFKIRISFFSVSSSSFVSLFFNFKYFIKYSFDILFFLSRYHYNT